MIHEAGRVNDGAKVRIHGEMRWVADDTAVKVDVYLSGGTSG